MSCTSDQPVSFGFPLAKRLLMTRNRQRLMCHSEFLKSDFVHSPHKVLEI